MRPQNTPSAGAGCWWRRAGRYGFVDALHPAAGWYDSDVSGMYQGVSVLTLSTSAPDLYGIFLCAIQRVKMPYAAQVSKRKMKATTESIEEEDLESSKGAAHRARRDFPKIMAQ